MLMAASSFNHPLNNWNVSRANVTDVYGMYGMFADVTSFTTSRSIIGTCPMAPWWPRERAYDHEESESDEESHWGGKGERRRTAF